MGLHYLLGLLWVYKRSRGICDACVTVTSEVRAVFENVHRRHQARICWKKKKEKFQPFADTIW